jgi:hypothetical protein
MVLESGLATIWPTRGLTSVAFISFFLARTFTIPWLWMEAVVGLRVYDGQCGVVAMGQGLFIRSYWAVGSLIGLRYIRGLEAEGRGESAVPGGGLRLHPRMWRMVQSPFFHRHACAAMLAWLLMSVLECFKLYHWEAGVPASSQELDAFRYTKAFFSQYTKSSTKRPLEHRHLSRVVGGNWREVFYLIMFFPKSSLFLAAMTALVITTVRSPWSRTVPWKWLRAVACGSLLGIASYVLCLSAHQLQFLFLCLLVSWECHHLQEKCEAFQDSFEELSTQDRLVRHQEIGSKVEWMGNRLQPIILFLVSERALQMSFDVARWRCESSPFTLLHYVFRHIVRTLGVLVVVWRIGRLNASIYDDLIGEVKFRLMCCHQRPGPGDEERCWHRKELKDWAAYLQHNSHGHRRYCLRVCGFQCCLHPHTTAAWAVTLALIPAAQKLFGLLPGL